jgi:uncharacterized membrane protein
MTAVLLPAYADQWLEAALRYLHVVAGIAWIGASFYFIALDNHLRPPERREDRGRGVGGEAWEIHGGGFYRIEKFAGTPRTIPEPLHWFKWEAYTTWLSGFSLFVVLYYLNARVYMIDPSVANLSPGEAVGISIGMLVGGWLVYDLLCRALPDDDALVGLGVAGLAAAAAWGSWQLFAPRAAWIQVGAMLGTIMAANVFFVIIPAHWELIRARQAGREPDPAWGMRGKQRSVHNNYLTLPVLVAMLSNHWSFLYGQAHAWAVLIALMGTTAIVRHYFNLRHRGWNVWPILLGAAAVGGAVAGDAARERDGDDGARARGAGRVDRAGREAVGFAAVLEITAGGFVFRAELHEDVAPKTVAAFRRLLPLDSRIIHVRWSGEGGWIPWGDLELGIGPENATSYPSPGELVLYPGGVSETELLLAYGYVNFASKAGQLAGNHFATIVEGGESLRELGRRMLWDGAQEIRFREA